MRIEITVSLKEHGRQKSISELVKEVAEKLRTKSNLFSQSLRLRDVKRSERKLIVKYEGLPSVIEKDESSSPYQEFDEEYEKTEDNDVVPLLNIEKPDNPIL